MIVNNKVVVVMPAYNAAKTLEKTYKALPFDIVDDVILVDDCSDDETVLLAQELGIKYLFSHTKNRGYGANQKTCYQKALEIGADIVVMVHPDYQYEPKLITAMSSLIAYNIFDSVLGSRILGTGALKGGMPLYKYISNRFLTAFQNILIPYKLTEYHSGYRAFSADVLRRLPLNRNSDDFVFDNQMLVQIIAAGYQIGEVTCPTYYATDSSSINFKRSVIYGLGVLGTTLSYVMHKTGIKKNPRYIIDDSST